MTHAHVFNEAGAKPGRSAFPSPGAAAGSIRFDRLGDDDPLIRGWGRLDTAAVLPTQGYGFTAALSRTMLAGTPIEVFHVGVPGSVSALLPLCRDPGYFARWRIVGAAEVFEPGDALYETPEAAHLLARTVTRGARPLRLDRVPASSQLVPALKAAMRRRGWVSVRPAVPCPTIALDARWKDPESRFNAGRRSDFRRAARKAEEFGTTTYEIRSPAPREFDALFNEAIAVELCSWKKDAGTAIASDRSKEGFFREFFRSACERGTFRLSFMRIEGRAVAMQMAVVDARRYSLFKIGYDETYKKCSPGNLLMLYTLGFAAAQDMAAYEMLGSIEPWIAQLWTRAQHDCVQLRTYPFSLRGGCALAADAWTWLRVKLVRALK